jgi:hypothetical protein
MKSARPWVVWTERRSISDSDLAPREGASVAINLKILVGRNTYFPYSARQGAISWLPEAGYEVSGKRPLSDP